MIYTMQLKLTNKFYMKLNPFINCHDFNFKPNGVTVFAGSNSLRCHLANPLNVVRACLDF
jgi:hypothetical protein